ncbi:MAG: hypothetical protein SFY81_12995 [Verrucomicrobiota bacterium]|nr:hypothetical protein [Verrucomicrobiota bacterium]
MRRLHFILLAGFSLFVAALPLRSAETIDVTTIAPGEEARLLPIAFSGFNGEAARVIRFDLEIAGFRIVPEDQAQYIITGRSSDPVEGSVTDRFSKSVLFSRRYSGSSIRSQAHAFSDDVVAAILKTPGISRTKIVFKNDTGRNSELMVADYDGHNAVQVTQDNSIVAAPTWVPGKRTLFYTSYKSSYPDIYSHDLNTGERRVIARYPGLNTSPAVSPDGRKVAMILSKDGSPDLYVSNIDGSELLQLTRTREDESAPCWSPDGKTICVVSRINEKRGLYVVPATGGKLTRLSTAGILNPTEPEWSPDGKKIVFTSQMGGFNICTIPAQGGQAEILAAGEDPSWAPNSRTVVFTRRIKNKRVLSLLDVHSKRVKDIAQISGSCSQPSWAK